MLAASTIVDSTRILIVASAYNHKYQKRYVRRCTLVSRLYSGRCVADTAWVATTLIMQTNVMEQLS